MRADRKADRNSTIELLRIVSALLIIAYHMTRTRDTSQPLIVYASKVTLGSWGILGVDLFLIISAWFLTDRKFRTERLVKLAFQVFTYSSAYTAAYLLYHLFRNNRGEALETFAQSELFMIFQPFWANCYWFVTAYFFLLILSPFLNRILYGSTQRDLEKILIALAFAPFYAQFSTSAVCNVACFAYAYLLTGYIKLHRAASVLRRVRFRHAFFITASIILANLIIYFTDDSWLGKSVAFLLANSVGAIGRHSLVMLLDAMTIFLSVVRCKPRRSRFINALAGCTLGVYLFHESNLMFMPSTIDIIQEKLSDLAFYHETILFPAQYLGVAVTVFLVGAGIEYARQILIQRPVMALINRKFSETFAGIDNWMNADSPPQR